MAAKRKASAMLHKVKQFFFDFMKSMVSKLLNKF